MMRTKLTNLLGILTAPLFLLSCSKNNKTEPISPASTKVLALASTAQPAVASDGSYILMTFNIREDAPDTGNRNWTVRRPLVKERIDVNGADIIGVQEAKGNQVSDMETDLPGFYRIGTGRDGNGSSEHSCIFYRTSRFKALNSGTFWLSPGAPTTATGPSWDAAYKRICSWAQFQDKSTSLKFWVFVTHFDQKGKVARDSSANLILSQIQSKIGAQPAIFMGDLNCTQTSVPYATLNNSSLLAETWNIAASKAPTSRGTFNGWNINPTSNDQIDHIFVTGEWTVSSRLVDWHYKTPGNIVPSDHWPVIAQMKIDGVTFFQDAQYGGDASQTLPVGNYTLSQLIARGMPNDWASSVKVPSGRKVIMYADDNFSGTSWTLTSDTPLLSALSPTANDKVSSVKVE